MPKTSTGSLSEAQGRFLQEPNYAVVAALRPDLLQAAAQRLAVACGHHAVQRIGVGVGPVRHLAPDLAALALHRVQRPVPHQAQ